MGIKKFVNGIVNGNGNSNSNGSGGLRGALNFAIGNAEQIAADANISFFECTQMNEKTIMMPATKVQRNVGTRGGKANSKGTPNLIANGSVFNVGINQCAILIENGRVHDCVVALTNEEAGQYTYQSDAEPSWMNYLEISNTGLFDEQKSSGQKIKSAMNRFANEYKHRFMAGGQSTNTMYLMYLNLKPLFSIPCGKGDITIKDVTIGRTIKMGCHGHVALRVTNPVYFFENFVYDYTKPITVDEGNVASMVKDVKELFKVNLAPMVKLSAQQGYGWQDFCDNSGIIGSAATEILGEQLLEKYGLGIFSANFEINIDAKLQEQLMRLEEMRDIGNDAAVMRAMHAEGGIRAMNTAAGNRGGTMVGMYGMNSMMNATNNAMGQFGGAPQQAQFGGFNQVQMGMNMQPAQPMSGSSIADQLRARQGIKKPEAQTANEANGNSGWTCECGASNITSKFCPECGKPKPEPVTGWSCECGATNITSKFCPECGKPKPEAPATWTCECGAQGITSKFCPECGKPKPTESAKPKKKEYKCDKCGWVPADPTKPPRFCPECGDVFDANDAQ